MGPSSGEGADANLESRSRRQTGGTHAAEFGMSLSLFFTPLFLAAVSKGLPTFQKASTFLNGRVHQVEYTCSILKSFVLNLGKIYSFKMKMRTCEKEDFDRKTTLIHYVFSEIKRERQE
ncbi:hypothetical protein Celaphus_00005697 [Cervus elaphus hippelaphus]|uniref:Uncharacterized protein n=1 Tax=Cervus elaphus hippelaphus TaxID=46360 RepID=A0A212CX39_CEREH|nr:hypothetical protein Celaphus_00005697 [Cervus elaphus hippelaphus]